MQKIVIVGAGPAGAMLASLLDGRFEVTIIDRKGRNRDKLCGGVLIDDSIAFLKRFSLPSEIFSRPKKLSLKYVDWDNGFSKKQDKYFFNIDRREFDNWLFDNALKNPNVKFICGVVKKISFNNKFKINIESDTVSALTADLVIDATGAFSITRHTCKKNIYTAVQFSGKNVLNEKDFLYVLSNKLTDYYLWLVPKRNDLLVGACLNGVRVYDKIILMKNQVKKNLGVDIATWDIKAAPMIRPKSVNEIELVRENILVVGEAAGLIDPSTGEGISFALRSAEECAKAINSNSDLDIIKKNYLKDSKYLIDEISRKINKAKLFVDITQRKAFVEQICK
jgi:geranylgeranyl diphosphate/geranylgeranyl-bacteriochlorophyllide a reductase